MSAWHALLESLHSAMIDELNSRLPDQKPVLGLPRRTVGFTPASEKSAGFLATEVILEDAGKGAAFVAIEPGLSNGGGLGAEAEERLWGAIVKRATPDFARRKINPIFGRSCLGQLNLPEGIPKIRVIIWIPLGFARGHVYLGLGAP